MTAIFKMFGCPQGNGIKPISGASPKISVTRLSDGEGEAKRKAGLMECSESLLSFLVNRGQVAAADWWACCCVQPAVGEGSAEGPVVLETSGPRGVVFGVPGGHRP